MALTLLLEPIKSTPYPTNPDCNIIAGYTQIPYKLQRKDFALMSAGLDGGFMYVRVAGDQTAYFSEGDSIYTDHDFYTGNAIVTTVTYVSSTKIETNIQSAGGAFTSGFVNAISGYEDYKVLISVYDVVLNQIIGVENLAYKPNNAGILFIDIRGIITPSLQDKDFINAKFSYKEYYNGVAQSSTDADEIFVLSARKTIQDNLGSCMYLNFLFTSSGNGYAEELTKFENPVKWRLIQMGISHVADDNFYSRNGNSYLVSIFTKEYNINRVLTYTDFGVNRNFLPGIYEFGLVEPTRGDTVFMSISIRYRSTSNEYNIERLYEIRHLCRNPVFIKWRNSLGAFSYWMFEVKQQYSIIAGAVEPYIEYEEIDIEDSEGTLRRPPADNNMELSCTAEKLTKDQLLALHELKSSGEVYYVITSLHKVRVAVSGGLSTESNTNKSLHDYNIKIRFPDNFII